MSIKRLSVGTVVGAVVMFALGYLIWEIIFAGFFAANESPAAAALSRETPMVWALALGTLSYALLIALALDRAGSATIADGLTVGAVVGFLLWFTADLTFYAIRDAGTLAAAVVDPVLEAVRGAVGGAVIIASRKLTG